MDRGLSSRRSFRTTCHDARRGGGQRRRDILSYRGEALSLRARRFRRREEFPDRHDPFG